MSVYQKLLCMQIFGAYLQHFRKNKVDFILQIITIDQTELLYTENKTSIDVTVWWFSICKEDNGCSFCKNRNGYNPSGMQNVFF